MNAVERDQKAYALARDFLLRFAADGVTAEILKKYQTLSESRPRPDSLAGVYERVLLSAQNANMKPSVVGNAIGGVGKLRTVLCQFEPAAVLQKYHDSWQSVLDEIVARLRPKGKIRRSPRSIWPKYCQTIISAARFLSQFPKSDEFYQWVEFFDQDDRARPALPMILSNEIQGIGFALACDFLKELGYTSFPKPDVHIKDIFTQLDLAGSREDYQVFKAVVRVASNSGVSPYAADKLFWLIGSGHFYEDRDVGADGRIGSHKGEFVAHAKKILTAAA